MRVGQISKAYKILTGDRSRLPQDTWAYELLKSKFPEQSQRYLSQERLTALRNFRPPQIEDIEVHVFESVILGQKMDQFEKEVGARSKL
jgi:hypothetical protein